MYLEHNCLQVGNDLHFGTILKQRSFAEQSNDDTGPSFKLLLCSKPAEEEEKFGIHVLNHANRRLTASKQMREKRRGFAKSVSADLRRVSSFSGIAVPDDRLRANELFKRLTLQQKQSSWRKGKSSRRRRAVGNLDETKEKRLRTAVYRYLFHGHINPPKKATVVAAKAEMVAARLEACVHVDVWKRIANERLRMEEAEESELRVVGVMLTCPKNMYGPFVALRTNGPFVYDESCTKCSQDTLHTVPARVLCTMEFVTKSERCCGFHSCLPQKNRYFSNLALA